MGFEGEVCISPEHLHYLFTFEENLKAFNAEETILAYYDFKRKREEDKQAARELKRKKEEQSLNFFSSLPYTVFNMITASLPNKDIVTLCATSQKLALLQYDCITSLDIKDRGNVIKIFNGNGVVTNWSKKENRKISDDQLTLFTNLTYLKLPHYSYASAESRVTDQSITTLTKLQTLDLRGNNTITDKGLSLLTNITNLDISNNAMITDKALSLLIKIGSLNLHHNSKITDNSLSILTNITNLDISNNAIITDKALSPLTKLISLKSKGYDNMTNKGLPPLIKLIPLQLKNEFNNLFVKLPHKLPLPLGKI